MNEGYHLLHAATAISSAEHHVTKAGEAREEHYIEIREALETARMLIFMEMREVSETGVNTTYSCKGSNEPVIESVTQDGGQK